MILTVICVCDLFLFSRISEVHQHQQRIVVYQEQRVPVKVYQMKHLMSKNHHMIALYLASLNQQVQQCLINLLIEEFFFHSEDDILLVSFIICFLRCGRTRKKIFFWDRNFFTESGIRRERKYKVGEIFAVILLTVRKSTKKVRMIKRVISWRSDSKG